MLFAGFFVTPELIPSWLRWAQYLCTLYYAVRLLLLEEFGGCASDGQGPCITLLDNTETDSENKWWYWLVLALLF
jgi:hypothetical protein